MKLQITLEKHELKTLVRKHLAKQGIVANDDDIRITDEGAVVFVEGKLEDEDAAIPFVPPAPPRPTEVAPAPPPTAPLGAIDGGQQPVDLTDVLGASQSIAKQKPGLYKQDERRLMEGESLEFPGVPKR